MKRLMKITAIWFLSSLFFVSLASAETYLVCDPQTGIDGYYVTFDGVTTQVPYNQVTIQLRDGSTADVALLKTVSTVTQGNHNVSVTAYSGPWESAPVPFDFTKPGINVPNLRLNSGAVQ